MMTTFKPRIVRNVIHTSDGLMIRDTESEASKAAKAAGLTLDEFTRRMRQMCRRKVTGDGRSMPADWLARLREAAMA